MLMQIVCRPQNCRVFSQLQTLLFQMPVASDETPASAEPSTNSSAVTDPRYEKFFRQLKMVSHRRNLTEHLAVSLQVFSSIF